MTNRFTRARSICGSCSGKSGTLSADCGDGTNAVVPGCARSTSRPQSMPATAMPLLIRNFLRVSDVLMNATLRRAHQKYFSNIAILVRPHAMAFPPRSRREAAVLMEQRTKRAQAGKAAFQTNCGYGDCCFLEKKFRPFYSAMIEVLMRRPTERAPKNSEKMKRRQTRRGGDLR